MKKTLHLLLLSISLVFLAFSLAGPSGLKILIEKRLHEYTSEKYPEKIYIHTDRPYYTAGESIWFSSYLVNGVTHTPSEKSKVIYVELINEENEVISDRKLFIESISESGDFKLPITLAEGTYQIRAFTNHMRNQSREYFFTKEIPVFALESKDPNEQTNEEAIADENLELPNIGFYPEGGYLVNGINNRVAVKIKDADLGANPIVGIIEDSDGNKVTEFKTLEFGLASFYLTPKAGKEYRAVISSNDEDIIYPLPNALSEGYVMNTSVNDDEVIINITTNKKEGLKNTLLIGHQRGVQAFDYVQDKLANSILVKIPKVDLIEGALDIVLFNESNQPVAERLAYIKKDEDISLSVRKTNGTKTGLRDLVNLEIKVTNNSNKIVPSTYSVSVTDTELINNNNNAENIKTYLLLNSDLRGKIKSPNYFFTDGHSIKKNAQLDLIMMTHGWRRFTWQELLDDNLTEQFKYEDGIYISGNTISAKPPYQNIASETKLTFRKQGFYQETDNTTNLGHFSYGPFIFNDTIDVFIQAGKALTSKNPNYNDTRIKLDPSAERPNIIPNRIVPQFIQNLGIENVENYRKKTKSNVFRDFEFDKDRELLDQVQLYGKVKSEEEKAEEKRDKRARYFKPSHRIVVDEYGHQSSGDFMSLLGNIPGVRIERKERIEEQLGLADSYVILLRGLEPAYYVDDVEVNIGIAKTIPQANIDFIDVRNTGHSSAAYGLKAQGIIAIYTKQGSRSGSSKIRERPGAINYKLNGFYEAREFYAPDYASIDRNRTQADYRTTLYWKPKITANATQNELLTFYTSDDSGRFRIEIEGITDGGIPFYKTSYLDVE